MATGDIKIHDLGGRTNPVVRRFPTALNGTAIKAGEPVMLARLGSQVNESYVVAVTTNKPIIGTDYFVGIAANASSETASANGYVDVYVDLPGIIWKAKAKTSTLADTQGEIDSSVNYLVAFDLTSSSYTIDNGTQGNTRGLVIVGGNPDASEIFFMCRDRARWVN